MRLVALLGAVVLTLSGMSPAAAADPAPGEPVATTLTLTAPASAYIQTKATVTATLRDADGTGVPQRPVVVESHTGGSWRQVATTTTDAGGVASYVFIVRPGTNRFRARFAGGDGYAASSGGPVDVRGVKVPTRLVLSGPGRVVDERAVRIGISWTAQDGRMVTGRVRLFSKTRGARAWRLVSRPQVRKGAAAVSVRPRVDTVWRAVGPAGPWFAGATSNQHAIDNVPPIAPVALPAGAPRPSVALPPQPRAAGAGLNAQVTRIPNKVWRSMVGRSWHRGCPVGRANLRLIRMNYWGFDGYRHRGEMVVHQRVARATVGVFGSLYAGRYPIRHMYRVDRFGWSGKLRGANDYRSMAADNASGFNCRQVVGRPGVRSPHSYGASIDINPWENPYVSRQGTYPNTWWLSRSHPTVAWRSSGHPVVRAFARHGFRWGGSFRDFHHFQR